MRHLTEGEQDDFKSVFDLADTGPIAAVLCHFNPCLYRSPVTNLCLVLNWLRSEGVPTYAVEVRSGRSANVPPVLPISHPKVLHFGAQGTMFRKDNLWNIAARRLPEHFKYVLCLDADVILTDPNWKNLLLAALDRHLVVQPFAKAVWTDSDRVPFKEKMSCGYGYQNREASPQISHRFHSGFAVAAHRSLWSNTEGFFNCPIGGGSLFFMSALMGLENELEPKLAEISPPLLHQYRLWAGQLNLWGQGSFGCTDGEVIHLWHGSRAKRRYRDRFDALSGFDPHTDVVALDPYGLHEWSASAIIGKPNLVAQVEDYFWTREEDETFISSDPRATHPEAKNGAS